MTTEYSCAVSANPAGGKPSVRIGGNRLMYEFTRAVFYSSHIPLAWTCHAQHQCL